MNADTAAVARDERAGSFFSLTPERVLAAVERSGHYTTGLCYALNSLENRVYEVELDDRTRVVCKFYRPGRWSADAIGDEHRLLAALREAEIPVCAPTPFEDGETLHATDDGIFFAVFPRTGGRCPDELTGDEFEQLGRLLGRIHNVAASLSLAHRPRIAPETYGTACLEKILARGGMSPGVQARYEDAVKRLVGIGERLYQGVETFALHGDCHRANLLRGRAAGAGQITDQFYFLDFDDCGVGPAVQDMWLLLPARPADCPRELDSMLAGYELFRPLAHPTLRLIELLRGLRYVRYAAWIAERWDDPSFPRAFPQWGTDRYWEGQVADLYEQIALLDQA
ncbi:MAG: serine/threonine protein kinase [Myxococcales bacterium]|nr:serine/threonine protein kinase [Myxococcales bacterium]